MIEILFLFGFIILGYASYTDWTTYEVPDSVSYVLIGGALALRGVWAFQESNTNLFLSGLFGFLSMAAIGCLFYYTAQWGGADAKLLMGVGAVFGLDLSADSLLAGFGTNLLLAGGLYGLCYMIVLGFKHRAKVNKQIKKLQRTKEAVLGKRLSFALTIITIIIALRSNGILQPMMFSIAVIMPVSYYLWITTKAVEEVALIKQIKPSQLTEGDWVIGKIRHEGKLICTSSTGVTKEQIKQLNALHKKGVIKEVTMKQGIPFIPAFLIAYVATITVGNIVLWILQYTL